MFLCMFLFGSFPVTLSVKERLKVNCDYLGPTSNTPEKVMAPHSSTLAWKIHGQRSLVSYSPWGCQESDTTERLHFHFSLSCIGEGNGNPLQCSYLENPREAWWAAIYGISQSRTRLKQLSSSNNTNFHLFSELFFLCLAQ